MERAERLKEFIIEKATRLNSLADKVKTKNENISQEDKDVLLPLYKEFDIREREI